MNCDDGKHIWTARFFENGSLAFWFCSNCGDTDRETGDLARAMEDIYETALITFSGVEPPVSNRDWKLADGSHLFQGDACSVSFMGSAIPGLPEAHDYSLMNSSGEIIREFRAAREAASSHDRSWILTRYQVTGNQLIKYRIHCKGSTFSDEIDVSECSGVPILADLVSCSL